MADSGRDGPSARAPGTNAPRNASRRYVALWSAYLREKTRQQDLQNRVARLSEREPEAVKLTHRQQELWKKVKELETRRETLQNLRHFQQALDTLGGGDGGLAGSHANLKELMDKLTQTLNGLETTSRPLSLAKATPVDHEALSSSLGELLEGPHQARLQLLLNICKNKDRLHMASKAILEELTSIEAQRKKIEQKQLYLEFVRATKNVHSAKTFQ